LSIFHEGEIIKPFYYNFMVAITILVALLVVFLFIKKKYRTFGLLLILYISILPVFSPIVVAWFIAERYLYVGSFAFLIIVTSLLLNLERKTFKNLSLYIVIVVFIIFGVRTVVRTHDFKTNKGIWLATLKNAPLSYRVFNNLGDVYTKEGEYEEAIKYFEQSVRLKPDYADAVYNIGYVYTLLPDFEKAQQFLLKSIEMNPRIFQSYYVLGIISYKTGDLDTAIKLMQKTLEINPQYELAQRAIQELLVLKQKGVGLPAGSAPGGSVPGGAINTGSRVEQLISDQTQPPAQPQVQPGIQEQQPVQPPAPQQQVPVLPILQGATVPN
jgi:tetratricopeptide (TPR) repeat protein